MPRVPALKWAPHRLQHFREWIQHELTQTIADRAPLELKWRDQIIQYRASLPKTQKDFPFVGASNIEFPLTSMHGDPIYSDFREALGASDNYYTVTAKRPDRTEHANPLTEFFKALDSNYLKMRRVDTIGELDKTVHGTVILKNHWLHEKKSRLDRDQITHELKKVPFINSHPRIERVPLQYFYIPAYAWDIDPDAPIGGAPWCAQKFYVTPSQLKQRAKSDGTFLPDYNPEAVDIVSRFVKDKPDENDAEIRKQDNYEPWSDAKIELFEVHARFDADGDGADEDIVAVFHKDTGVVLRATLSPFLHGKRPFHRDIYFPSFGFYGIGVAEKAEWAHVTLTKLFNGMLDNMLIVNTAMFAAPFGSSLRPGEPIYPGRIINYQPGEQPPTRIPLGELNQSWPQIQNFILQLADSSTGSSDVRRGNINNLPGRTPATTIMEMMQQGSKRFSMILNDSREVRGEMGLRLFQNVAQFYTDDPTRWMQFCTDALGEADASKVIEVLQAPISEIEAAFGVGISATSQMVNKEAEKQSFIGLMQIATSIYGQGVQTAMLLQQTPPGTPVYETAAASYQAITELLKRLLERFDIQNPDHYLGNMSAIASSLNAASQGQNAATMGMMQPPLPMSPYPSGGAVDPYIASLLGVQ